MARLKLSLIVLGGLLTIAGTSWAQTSPAPRPTPDAEVLANLPHPPDQPASLFAPPEVFPQQKPSLPLQPYALEDPLLDPPNLPPPGWFADVWADLVHPHLANELLGVFTQPNGIPQVVRTGAAQPDWTVMPALSVGYRAGAGLGECSLLYRGFDSSGSTTFGPALQRSQLRLDVVELNYANDELFPYPHWKFKPQLGLRYAWDYFDTTLNAPADSVVGYTDRKSTNLSYGIGPHAGLLVGREIPGVPGLGFVGQIDLCGTLGWGKQQILQFSTPAQGGGNGEVDQSASSYFQILTAQAGLNYQPPGFPSVQLFVGYTFEDWWSVGIIRQSGGSFSLEGVALRANIQF
jgi:hypothetical protein